MPNEQWISWTFACFYGDILIVKTNSQFKEDVLSLFDTPDSITAGLAYENFDDVSIHNKNDWIVRFLAKAVKFVEVVYRVEISFNSEIC